MPLFQGNKHSTSCSVDVKALSLTTVFLLALSPIAALSALEADDIMQLVDARDLGDKVASSLKMTLIDDQGDERVRIIESLKLNVDDAIFTLSTFRSPDHLEGVKFLSYDYDAHNADDDQWIYLPEIKKVKRVASSDRSSSFFGSDFSYADMTKMPIHSYDFTLTGSKDISGDSHWVIEALPNPKERDRTGYRKVTLFVKKDSYVVTRQIIVLNSGEKKYFSATGWKNYDDVWFAHYVVMATVRGGTVQHKTELNFYNVSYDNSDITQSLFNPGLMKQ